MRLNKLKDKFFQKIHSSNLVYNTCWEDPRIDRELLEMTKGDEVVMITSAGCNALDYLLDGPKNIHCVDVNHRQNALLELKKSCFKAGDHEILFKMFGKGFYEEASRHYFRHLRKWLPEYAKEFWDEKHYYFNKDKKKKSFYFFGTAGSFAWLFNKYLSSSKERRALIEELFTCKSLKEQKKVYEKLEPVLMNKVVRWFMSRHITMSLLGVPRSQRQLILEEFEGGVLEFLEKQLKHVFTELPINENYFWYLYTHGRYSKENAPEYLLEKNFKSISKKIEHIKSHTSTLSDFLLKNPGQYSHFILLDHQDWLAHYDLPALEEEWKLILKNAKSGTKILMRSASVEIDYIPEFVKEKVSFLENASHLHQKDRVGTYGSTYLAVVN